jgi:hypothetical protein
VSFSQAIKSEYPNLLRYFGSDKAQEHFELKEEVKKGCEDE